MPTKDDFACKCGCSGNLIKDDIVSLCNKIQNQTGTLTITSGYRCKTHNAAVGGVANSQHLQGNAADITYANIYILKQVCRRLWSANEIGGLGLYSTFVHVDIGSHRIWYG